jgi:sugar O-acyltransferase (sialic acid O-acetyltransferase NeuD family)
MTDEIVSSTPHFSMFIFGAGGHARVVADLAKAAGFQIHGFIDTVNPDRAGESFAGSVVLGGMDVVQSLPLRRAVIAFGDNAVRLALLNELLEQGWELPVLVHPSSVVSESAVIGAGTVVMAQSCIQAGARLGMGCIVNTGAIAEHDGNYSDGVHLAPRACVCGTVKIGRGTFIGAGSVVRESLAIGSWVRVGAGSVVVNDLPDECLAYGSPARVIKIADS